MEPRSRRAHSGGYIELIATARFVRMCGILPLIGSATQVTVPLFDRMTGSVYVFGASAFD